MSCEDKSCQCLQCHANRMEAVRARLKKLLGPVLQSTLTEIQDFLKMKSERDEARDLAKESYEKSESAYARGLATTADELAQAEKERDEARAACAALRGALKSIVENYVCCSGDDDGGDLEGHSATCVVGKALSSTAGCELLARLEVITAELQSAHSDFEVANNNFRKEEAEHSQTRARVYETQHDLQSCIEREAGNFEEVKALRAQLELETKAAEFPVKLCAEVGERLEKAEAHARKMEESARVHGAVERNALARLEKAEADVSTWKQTYGDTLQSLNKCAAQLEAMTRRAEKAEAERLIHLTMSNFQRGLVEQLQAQLEAMREALEEMVSEECGSGPCRHAHSFSHQRAHAALLPSAPRLYRNAVIRECAKWMHKQDLDREEWGEAMFDALKTEDRK